MVLCCPFKNWRGVQWTTLEEFKNSKWLPVLHLGRTRACAHIERNTSLVHNASPFFIPPPCVVNEPTTRTNALRQPAKCVPTLLAPDSCLVHKPLRTASSLTQASATSTHYPLPTTRLHTGSCNMLCFFFSRQLCGAAQQLVGRIPFVVVSNESIASNSTCVHKGGHYQGLELHTARGTCDRVCVQLCFGRSLLFTTNSTPPTRPNTHTHTHAHHHHTPHTRAHINTHSRSFVFFLTVCCRIEASWIRYSFGASPFILLHSSLQSTAAATTSKCKR